MKKKLIVSMIVLLLITTGCNLIKDKKVEERIKKTSEIIPLMEFGNFRDIDLDKVISITFLKYTVAGRDDEIITDKERINNIYNNLSSLKVGDETNRSCEDNTEIYVFEMKDGKKISIEIECDWLVVGKQRYEIK